MGGRALRGAAALDARLPGGEWRVLLPFHPRALEEDLLAGRTWRVERVLAHLALALAAAAAAANGEGEGEGGGRAGCAGAATVFPQPLLELLAEAGVGGAGAAAGIAVVARCSGGAAAEFDFFAPKPMTELYVLPAQPPVAPALGDGGPLALLSERLQSVAVAGLSGPEQRRLLTVCSLYARMHEHMALDECGLRFLLRVKLAADARRGRGGGGGAQPLIRMADCVWAVHSECHEALAELCFAGGAGGSGATAYAWAHVSDVGGGYWLSGSGQLRATVERVAKAQFSLRKEPDDAAPFYMALGKKAALLALYMAVGNEKLVGFLSNDFETERWRTAALKNAYALVSRRNWPLAVAFFLLAKAWRDACAICARHMKDVQLALVVAALAPLEPLAEVQHLLEQHLLGGRGDEGDARGCGAWHCCCSGGRTTRTPSSPPRAPSTRRRAAASGQRARPSRRPSASTCAGCRRDRS
ncbi:RAVE protein 1 C terminal-domain-containing protein [Pavlovales sp. CCMP2436]|nr:RAVE protein 1 C terminal-domain-containing protein [Pavlovales sp. CCMP2436]